jgi:hypothetical protein
VLESDHTMVGDSFSAGTRIEGGIGFRPQMVRGASVPRFHLCRWSRFVANALRSRRLRRNSRLGAGQGRLQRRFLGMV